MDFTATEGISGAEEIVRRADFKSFPSRYRAPDLEIRHPPSLRYRTFVIRPRDEFRLLRCASQEISVEGLRLVHVMKMLGDTAAIPAAVAFLNEYCNQERMHVMDFFCTSVRLTRFLVTHGWFSTLDHDFFAFPYLFWPVELRSPATTSDP